MLADRQPQPGPTKLARGRRVSLGEFLEDVLELVFGDTDAGVFHCESEPHLAFGLFFGLHVDQDMPLAGKLDGVVGQVGQHLADPSRIADDAARGARGIANDQGEAFLLGPHRQQVHHFIDGDPQVKGDRFHE